MMETMPVKRNELTSKRHNAETYTSVDTGCTSHIFALIRVTSRQGSGISWTGIKPTEVKFLVKR